MAAFKKLFSPSSPRGEVQGISSQQYANSSSRDLRAPASPYVYPLQSHSKQDVNRHYEGIERQFEQLHETFYSRTLASLRQFRYTGGPHDALDNKNRHIDVVEALFSNHRYQMPSTRSISPITPYNEDVADRNIIAHNLPQLNLQYSRLGSGLYQEDVADRNISRSKSSPIYRGPRSSRLNVRPSDCEQKPSSSRSKSQGRLREPRTSYPPASCRKSCSRDRAEKPLMLEKNQQKHQSLLRPQVSAPDLSMPEIKTPDLASFPRPPTSGPDAIQQEPVRKAEKMPEREPPDASEDLTGGAPSEKAVAANSSVLRENPNHDKDKSDSKRVLDASLSTGARTSKKNVRDLIIDTDIAASKKPSIRIEHCAIQPPTPDKALPISQNASIDEIVHTPLATVGSNRITPQPSPALDVDEIMRILKQAYNTTQQNPDPLCPTFETLQEVIVREINSHDAFRKVPLPSNVLVTPPSSEDSLEDDILLPPPGPSQIKSAPEKGGPLSRLIRRRSTKGRSSQSPNTSPVKTPSSRNSPPIYAENHSQSTEMHVYSPQARKTAPRDSQPSIPRRRRHTYGEPPTPSAPVAPTSQQQTQPPPQQRPKSRPRIPAHTSSSASISSSSSFSLFPTPKRLPEPRYKSHFKRKSDPVPPSPHFTEFIPADAATPPIFPSYVRQH